MPRPYVAPVRLRLLLVVVGALALDAGPGHGLDPVGPTGGSPAPRGHLQSSGRAQQPLEPGADPLAVALGANGWSVRDLAMRIDLDPPDRWRRSIVNRCLSDPTRMEPEIAALASRILGAVERPGEALRLCSELADLSAPDSAPGPVALRGAVARFLGVEPSAMSAPQLLDLGRLEALPPAAGAWLARLLAAHAAAREATAAVVRRIPAPRIDLLDRVVHNPARESPEEVEQALSIASAVDLRALVGAATALATVIQHRPAGLDRLVGRVRTVRLEGRHGTFVLGGPGDDLHPERAVLVVDCGGNDRYEYPRLAPPVERFGQVRVLIDLGGDDLYRSASAPLAGGFGSVGIVWDDAGDDAYDGPPGSLGAGVLGVGLLVDLSGNDVYRVSRVGQGCGVLGVGLLLDGAGHDAYQARLAAQGYAGVGGVGLLVDRAGHDTYYATAGQKDFRGDLFDSFAQGCGLGWRNRACGGVAGLIDGSGNDAYSGEYWAQGVGYWYGLGFLVDLGGRDRYVAGRYAQGAGVHLAAGLLVDRDGHDNYVATAVCQGTGYDRGVGVLHDLEGNDVRVAHDLSQGCGFANGFGLLRDDHGCDVSIAWELDSQGYGTEARSAPSIGVHLDLGGIDRYVPEGRNNTVLIRGQGGILLDAPGR
ncbi:MAG: hypothetical protein HY815_12080 [Candidatus Riflebacteria bacterium]|nr:hypothetical protein [Candidatus Riflebacteria bacterium]